jgi:hypothetical protein
VLGIVATAAVNHSLDLALSREPALSAATRGVLETQRAVIVSGALPAGITQPVERARVGETIAAASARGFTWTLSLCAVLAACAAVLALDGSLANVDAAGRGPSSEPAAA